MAKKAKIKTRTSKAGNKRQTRPQVISFRITATQAKTLTEIFTRDVATGVKSPNQFARKVVCDYLAGRLDYRDPNDKLQDVDGVGA